MKPEESAELQPEYMCLANLMVGRSNQQTLGCEMSRANFIMASICKTWVRKMIFVTRKGYLEKSSNFIYPSLLDGMLQKSSSPVRESSTPLFLIWKHYSLFNLIYFFIFLLFRVVPAAYGSSQARGQIGSCRCQPTPQPQQLRIELPLQPIHHGSQQRQILNPLIEARDRTCVLMDASQVHDPLHHKRNSLNLANGHLRQVHGRSSASKEQSSQSLFQLVTQEVCVCMTGKCLTHGSAIRSRVKDESIQQIEELSPVFYPLCLCLFPSDQMCRIFSCFSDARFGPVTCLNRGILMNMMQTKT